MLRFRIGETRVRVSVLFFAAAVVWLTLDESGLAVFCLLASFLHEMGHLAALAICGKQPAEVCAGIFGVRMTQNPKTPLSYWQNIFVSLAGPAVNLVMAALLTAVRAQPGAVAVQLTIGFFNLLPVEALDGGQALLCLLCTRVQPPRAEQIVLGVSIAAILPLATVGCLLLLISGYNFTLLAVSLYLGLLLLFKRR